MYENPPPCLPIIIAGSGCVGLFLALLLAPSIPNRIIILDPVSPDPSCTRAMAHQPPTYPIYARVPDLLAEMIERGSLSTGLCFRTAIKEGSTVIAGRKFGSEGKGRGQVLLPQGVFQGILLERLVELGERVEVRLGVRVTGLSHAASSVHVAVQNADGALESIEAAYLVGADGAHSMVRKAVGTPFEGETLDAQLVATDLHFDFHAHGFYDANFIIDPLHYGLIGRISAATPSGPPLWRVSYGVSGGMSEVDIRASVDQDLEHMLPNGGRNADGKKAYEVVRIAPYKAQQRCANTLYTERVCLVGDAAHVTNPYAGLGLASGIADASSLSDVLSHILTGQAGDAESLLAAWSDARREKFAKVVDGPSRMAYARVRSDVSSEEKLEALTQRDLMMGALKKGMPVIPPSLETKGEELEGW